MATILLIDDTAAMRKTVRAMLEAGGYKVVEAENGEEGLARLDNAPVDLIVTDVFMPGMDGIEFIRKIRDRSPLIPIIAISGGSRTMPSSVGLSLTNALGASQTLFKPFRQAELMHCVEIAMAGVRA